ncbi:DUF4114 domain-containing protein [Reyranella sp.]|uniref:DUF4114 domain-containing protein n=1 Tax=Reyranella sp. TaxID=1929291 RepID=UPI003BAD49D5
MPPIDYQSLTNASFGDFMSYRSGAVMPSGGALATDAKFNVALIFERASDPTALLASNWGSRQLQLQALNDSGTLWTTYGADRASYDAALSYLGPGAGNLGLVTLDGTNSGYVSSAESRTIWVQLDEHAFETLFGTALRTDGSTLYWEGNLALPTTLTDLGVNALWFDTKDTQFSPVLPPHGKGVTADLPQGWQSPGNAASEGHAVATLFPNQIAFEHYNFPLSGELWGTVPTGAIGLVEPGVGTALPSGATADFATLVDAYRALLGITTPVTVVDVAGGGQTYPTAEGFTSAGERSLDVGVVTGINPLSPLVLYAGSGHEANANGQSFTAYQSAIWDLVNNPRVITSSFAFPASTAPNSPFYIAMQELFIDAALRNITVFSDDGDLGSGDRYGNGLTNVTRESPFTVMVGGTSLSTVDAALGDPTIADIVQLALAGDQATLWQLVAGGLTVLPSPSVGFADLIETVWNQYYLDGNAFATPGSARNGAAPTGYFANHASAGGVDFNTPVPWYQAAFGLSPTTADPDHLVGRGIPDVSANAGGNMLYRLPASDLVGLENMDGTSAATPLWASLAVRINAIFADQGLPNLGYASDLLYTAAAIAPASFNDITIGNNISSFVLGGDFHSDGHAIRPTGFGYHAVPGYDLTTGLGSPNGTLLARALSTIAHSQMYFSTSPAMLDEDGAGGWLSSGDQSLMFQMMSGSPLGITLDLGAKSLGFANSASGTYAWTARMAQQALQPDFDPRLVTMFDKQAQGFVGHSVVEQGEGVAVTVGGISADAIQATLSSTFGFADFVTAQGVVRVARPVAVAETAGGADDTTAIVRVRQNGEDSLSLTFYRVDDHTGTIDGVRPDHAAYAGVAAGRAYQLGSGGTSLGGPGYGNFEQAGLLDVDAGDLIAMKLVNNTTGATYWAFASANETAGGQHVGHLWNYGLNVWGWEDTYGGGDRDYNDLIVQLDFTSSAGHGWLVS